MLNKFSTMALVLLNSACSIGAQWPYNNFNKIYSHQVGKSLDASSLYERRKIGSRTLPSGNIETEYLHGKGRRGICRVFYEIDPKTRIIVGWRYEGDEKACAISP